MSLTADIDATVTCVIFRWQKQNVWGSLLAFHKDVWCRNIALLNQNLHKHTVTCKHIIEWNRASVCEALDLTKLGTGVANKGNTSCMHSQERKLCVNAKLGFNRGQNCAQVSGVTALMPW